MPRRHSAEQSLIFKPISGIVQSSLCHNCAGQHRSTHWMPRGIVQSSLIAMVIIARWSSQLRYHHNCTPTHPLQSKQPNEMMHRGQQTRRRHGAILSRKRPLPNNNPILSSSSLLLMGSNADNVKQSSLSPLITQYTINDSVCPTRMRNCNRHQQEKKVILLRLESR